MSYLDSVKLNTTGYLAPVDGEATTRVGTDGGKVTKPESGQNRREVGTIPELKPIEATSYKISSAFAPAKNGVTCPVARVNDGMNKVAVELDVNA